MNYPALSQVREYLEGLAKTRTVGVTADDAREYVMLNSLPPLGNAAGTLFNYSKWQYSGIQVPSTFSTNRGRKVRVWELVEAQNQNEVVIG